MNIFSKVMRAVIFFAVIICILFSFSACTEFARRKPFTAVEMEKYMEKTYDEDFTVLSRKEIYDSYTNALKYVEYEIQCDETGVVFEAKDMYDGAFAGFDVYDDFEKISDSYND